MHTQFTILNLILIKMLKANLILNYTETHKLSVLVMEHFHYNNFA